MAREEAEVRDEFAKGLVDLVVNNKALINMFTMLAEENIAYADAIVETIENHMLNAEKEYKLYSMYLIDSIMKNVGKVYKDLFAKNIVHVFLKTFERVDEKTRACMYKLRHTWTEVFSPTKLYAIDCRVHSIDPAWPIVPLQMKSNIHVNPRFLITQSKDGTGATTTTKATKATTVTTTTTTATVVSTLSSDTTTSATAADKDPILVLKKKELVDKQQKLLEIKQKQLELELMRIEAQKKQLNDDSSAVIGRKVSPVTTATSLSHHKSLLKPEAVRELEKTQNENLNHCVLTKTADTVSLFPVQQQQSSKKHEPLLDPRLARTAKTGKRLRNATAPESETGLGSSRTKRTRSPQSETESCSNAVSTSSLPTPSTRSQKRSLAATESPSSSSSTSSPVNDTFDSQSRSLSFRDLSNDSLVDSIVKKSFDIDGDGDDRDEEEAEEEDEDEEEEDLDVRTISKRSPDSTGSTNRNYYEKGLKVLSSKRSKIGLDKNRAGAGAGVNAAVLNTNLSLTDEDIDLRTNKTITATAGVSETTASKSGSSNSITSSVSQKTPLPQAPPPPKISDKQQLNSLRAKLASVPNLRKAVVTSSSAAQTTVPATTTVAQSSKPKTKLMHRSLTELIAEASEQLKRGEITAAEMSEMVQSLMLNKEMEQVNEAKKQDEDLQPISDDELIVESNRSEDETMARNSSSSDDRVRSNCQRRRVRRRPFRRHPYRNRYGRRNRSQSSSLGSSSDDGNDSCDGSTKRRRRDSDDRRTESRRDSFDANVMFFDTKKRSDKYRRRSASRSARASSNQQRNFSPELPTSSTTTAAIPAKERIAFQAVDYRSVRSPPPISVYSTRDLAPVNPILMDYVEKDTMRTITIDGTPREIRFYGETAVIFLNWDDPREISFQNGARLVTFNGNESFLLGFNEPFKELLINGNSHKVRLGAPTRELIIDNNWYECIFGGAEFLIKLAGQMVRLRLDGPPPQVKISDHRRTDLVLGKINMIVDGQQLIPVFLDAKTQIIQIEKTALTLRFANSLKTVLINETPFRVEFNSKPKPIMVANRKHFIRFSILPDGIQQGGIRIANMEEWLTDTKHLPFANIGVHGQSMDALKPTTASSLLPANSGDFDFRQHFQAVNVEDMLSSAVSTSMAPTIMGSYNLSASTNQTPVTSTPQVLTIRDNSPPPPTLPSSQHSTSDATLPPPTTTTTASNQQQSFPNLGNININELYQKLVATGIIPNSNPTSSSTAPQTSSGESGGKKKTQITKSKKETDQESLSKLNWLEEVSLDDRDSLKIRNGSFINSLYTGMQCSSCGIRFLPEDNTKYSQHLDWHFHTNRMQKSLVNVPLNRRWFLTVDNVIKNCAIDNLMLKEKYWTEIPHPPSSKKRAEEEAAAAAVQALPTVASQSTYYMTEMCFVCYDKFDEFFNEDEEEWHLRNAVRIDNKLFHPICHEDYLKSLKKRDAAIAADAAAASEEITDSSDLMIIDVNESAAAAADTVPDKKQEVTETTTATEPEVIDNSILIIEELSPEEVRKRKEQNCPVIDLADDECSGAVTANDSSSNPIQFDFANVRVKTEPGLETEQDPDILTDTVIECETDPKLDDNVIETDDNQINKMNVEYSFDGYELPTASTTVPQAPLKITVSQNLLANKRQKTSTAAAATASAASDSKDEDDIVIEKIDRIGTGTVANNSSTTTTTTTIIPDPELKPHSVKNSLQNVQLTRKPLVFKGVDETSLCTIM